MNRLFIATTACCAALVASAAASENPKSGWTVTTWNGERAYVAGSSEWKAIVSVDRGRLVYVGSATEEKNLLFAPPSREADLGWGGHRVWCGPQDQWQGGWPPPAAWEHSAAANVEIDGERIELEMPDSPDGWPRMTRDYLWKQGALHCRVRISGGKRDAQIIQIVQVPAAAEVVVSAEPTARTPRGYVQVHLGRQPSPRFEFPAPPHVAANGDTLHLAFTGEMEKFGFMPQALRAKIGKTKLIVARGESDGNAVSEPDAGYMTQVYFGSTRGALIELEQLSPLWRAGSDASFEMVLRPE